MKLHQHETEQIRGAFRMIGIEPDTDDDTFMVGRSDAAAQQAG
jgi:hypothetical protein